MEFADGLAAIEAIARRHVPACYYVVAFGARATGPRDFNPAPFVIELTIRRVSGGEEPPDWRLHLVDEVRRGWDAWEFQFGIHELESEYDEL